jgi:hypothetical protein
MGEIVAPPLPGGGYGVADCGPNCQRQDGGLLFVGAEYRFIRASFSEAVAFASVNDAITGGGFVRDVRARELSFDYDSSMRFYLGMHLGECQDVRFSYWNFDTDVNVAGTAGLGQTLVDPFGNLALTGSSINTNASLNLNVYDLEYLQRLTFGGQHVQFQYSAGLRFADVDQNYNSTIRNGVGTVLSTGNFDASFFGVGPQLAIQGRTFHYDRRLSFFAKGGTSLLIGQYDVASQVAVPGVTGGQSAGRIRAVPVLEAELAGSWQASNNFTLTAGWLFQAWFNIGTSGGTFDGENIPGAPVDTAFGQTDDADIMSFDGLFVRAEYRF